MVSKGRLEIMATDDMMDRLPAHITFLPPASIWGLPLLDRALVSGDPSLPPLDPSRGFLVVHMHPGGQASARRADVRKQRRRTLAIRLIHIDRLAPCHILHST